MNNTTSTSDTHPPEKIRTTVLGGGSFGTALANILALNAHDTCLWMRNAERVEEIRRTGYNQRYLPDCKLPKNLQVTADLTAALAQAEVVFFAIPSKAFRGLVLEVKPYIDAQQILVSTTKGIEQNTFQLMGQILEEQFPENPIGVLSGPNLAKELAKYQPAATVIASDQPIVRDRVQKALGCRYLRVYASSDMFGVALGGVLKNIYAIVTGFAASVGFGENTKSMLITRSLAEMSRFAVKLGANPMTFLGLSGVGDLIVTCMSPLSRNYRVGYGLGKGKALEQVLEELGEVAEGIDTLKVVRAKAEELDVYMPLVNGLYEVIYNKASISQVAKKMMLGERSTDVEFVLPKDQI